MFERRKKKKSEGLKASEHNMAFIGFQEYEVERL